MALEDDIRLLAKVDLFQGLDREQLRLLAFGAERRRFRDGVDVHLPGDAAAGGMIITEGALEFWRQTTDGRKSEGIAGPVTLVGEMALLLETDRTHGATARGETEVLTLSRSLFRRMLEEYPDFALALHGRISERLANLAGDLLTLAPVFAREG
ncbi:MAG TPA: cyclic nucleotide-binding domain-containing protein [Rhizobiaceae bacterium]|nr:cyclic nucleotide-binding domain-containing protein [Rhizobiaceae bacterium]